MSLRRSFLVFAAVLAVIGTGTAITLITLATDLHLAGYEIRSGVESLRIGEELTLGLTSLREETDPLTRAANADLVRRRLVEAAGYMGDRQEEEILANLERQVDQYTAALDRAADGEAAPARVQEKTRAAFESAFALARQWGQINVEQGRAAERAAVRWGEIANVIGVAAILLLVVGLGGIAWWLQRRTFRPALQLARTIEHYARGDRSARAIEQNPAEFHTIARCFNDMAQTLERQRADQLAFLAGVAHDIRNPLGALKMATDMLPPDQPLPPEPRVRQLLARVGRQISRLERMAHDFLDASRIESGHLELQIEDCDMRELARATLDLFEPSASIHPLVMNAPDEPIYLRCDPVRIEQVLTNLVNNAIKYSPAGSSVRVTLTRWSESVLVSVADKGAGISPDDIEHIFDPFRRGGRATQAVPGLGLGLFVARRIVEAHGGEISVASTQGAGATFTVRLPVPGRHSPARSPRPKLDQDRGNEPCGEAGDAADLRCIAFRLIVFPALIFSWVAESGLCQLAFIRCDNVSGSAGRSPGPTAQALATARHAVGRAGRSRPAEPTPHRSPRSTDSGRTPFSVPVPRRGSCSQRTKPGAALLKLRPRGDLLGRRFSRFRSERTLPTSWPGICATPLGLDLAQRARGGAGQHTRVQLGHQFARRIIVDGDGPQ